ncbi:MAG: hypothetical protein IT375_34890 [Polyangiaceae bacterium]|nr:hypothetical protein [Polyangiaceae bacterium]
MMFPAIDGPAGMTLGARDNEDRPGAPPRSTRTSETAQHSADVDARRADEHEADTESPEAPVTLRGPLWCQHCGRTLEGRRAGIRYCTGACRVAAHRASKDADRLALPRVARARLAELRAEERRPSVAPYPPEEGRR